MNSTQQNLEALHDIRKMMDRSSRFISLSGWSGISAGLTALVGAWVAEAQIGQYRNSGQPCSDCLRDTLIETAGVIFVVAFSLAMLFTYRKSRSENVPFWGIAARRLLWNTMLPMLVGACLVSRIIELQAYSLLAPVGLLCYGLALINGSKYTMGEVRYLGYGQLIVGAISLLDPHHPLSFLATGFGVLHIVYGVAMWWKYDRKQAALH